MIDPHHPDLFTGQQCRLLSLSRSSFYDTPVPEGPFNLALMRLIDEAYSGAPILWGSANGAASAPPRAYCRAQAGRAVDGADGA